MNMISQITLNGGIYLRHLRNAKAFGREKTITFLRLFKGKKLTVGVGINVFTSACYINGAGSTKRYQSMLIKRKFIFIADIVLQILMEPIGTPVLATIPDFPRNSTGTTLSPRIRKR